MWGGLPNCWPDVSISQFSNQFLSTMCSSWAFLVGGVLRMAGRPSRKNSFLFFTFFPKCVHFGCFRGWALDGSFLASLWGPLGSFLGPTWRSNLLKNLDISDKLLFLAVLKPSWGTFRSLLDPLGPFLGGKLAPRSIVGRCWDPVWGRRQSKPGSTL